MTVTDRDQIDTNNLDIIAKRKTGNKITLIGRKNGRPVDIDYPMNVNLKDIFLTIIEGR